MKTYKPLTLEQAERLLLSNCPDNQRVIHSGDLIAKSERFGSGDVIRYAYWSLVHDGKLIRVPAGVYKK